MIPPHPILNQLLNQGRLTREQVDALREEHLEQGRSVREIAIEQDYLTAADYARAVAETLHADVIDLAARSIPEEARAAVSAETARMYDIVPIRRDDYTITLAVCDWLSPAMSDDIAFALSKPVEYVVATKAEIDHALVALYGENPEADPNPRNEVAPVESADLEHAANATPVVRFVNLVLKQAVEERASDIHFEPFDDAFKIRYRVDGALFEMTPPPAKLALPITSRIKVIAGLDIAESRLPQDGRIQLEVAGRSIDFRVSTLPTQFGESVVLRVLDRSNTRLEIEHLGFPADVRERFEEDIAKPNGIVLVTGPTGSGKTTTLYAGLQRINRSETKILTAEDPVEYDVEGVVQLPIRERIGLTFASALRAFLRQDPDVIMVGEIRDQETARIAIQASLTGHLVFSTLHTNDAPGAITRLIDMEVEPYLIASTLESVMAQRLLRGVCSDCSTPYRPSDSELRSLGLDRARVADRPFFRGTGCETCGGTGYRGRRALFEHLSVTDPLRAAILEKRSTLALREHAVELGMRTLREDGIRQLLDGATTVEEVLQYT